MWGNSLGWSLSMIIVALFVATIYLVDHASSATPPTAFSSDENNFAAIEFPKTPAELSPMSGGADRYAKAIALVEAMPSLYENFAKLGTLNSEHANQLEAVDLIVKASPDELFKSAPGKIITYAHAKPDLDALRLLGQITIDRLGLLNAKANKPDVARSYYEAGFRLGYALAHERLIYDEYQLGQELLSKSSAALAKLAESQAKAEEAAQWRAFDQARVAENKKHVEGVLRVVRSIDANTVGPRAGDVFELATRSKERMWRVEAILALGRMRYFAGAGGTSANQRRATQVLRDLAENDADPIVKLTASLARDLTVEEYRMQ